ncbi:MAG TPA: phosphotransferase [Stellaceae bacterium]|nr:phosphotransferase [Stellaceae bacterium]
MIAEPDLDLLPDDVVRILAQRAIDGEYPYWNCQVTGPLILRSSLRLFRCTVAGRESALALKFCLDGNGRPDRDMARTQFTALQRVAAHAALSRAPARVARAVDLIDEHACVVMEWVEGRSVAAMLVSPMISEAEIEFGSRSAGAWLKSFHAMHRLAERPTDCGGMLARLDHELRDTPKLRANQSFAKGDDILRRTAVRIASLPLPVAHHHGDFKAENLILSGGELVGLDISADWEDSISLDLAKFIGDIGFRSWRPSGWLLRRRGDAIVSSFLAGYGFRLEWQAPLHWAQLHGLLRFWIEVERAPSLPIRETYERYRFEQIVIGIADSLAAGTR